MENITEPERTKHFSTIMAEIVNTGMMDPIYIDGLQTENQCAKLVETLPMVYIWNSEKHTGYDSYSVSVNPLRVEDVTDLHVSANDPEYRLTRNQIIVALRTTMQASIASTISKTGAHPREICDSLKGLRGKVIRKKTVRYSRVGNGTPLSFQVTVDDLNKQEG